MRALRTGALTLLSIALPTLVFAQAAISGVVKDSSGSVLPGVTVEASSPSLIEKSRSTVTDGNGPIRSSSCNRASIRSPSRCRVSAPTSVKASSWAETSWRP